MNDITVSAIQAIQAMLAPAVGISAVGLLLLGLNNRYSTIINRIRLLNDEKRKYHRQIVENVELTYTDNARYHSISSQGKELLIRSRLVRNAILSLQTAVGLFVLASAAIGVNLFSTSEALRALPLLLFIVGMFSVFVGVVFAGREVYRSYKIVLIEANAEE
jgi:hypothetical protein